MSLVIYSVPSFSGSTSASFSEIGITSVSSVIAALSSFSVANQYSTEQLQQLSLSVSATPNSGEISIDLASTIVSGGDSENWSVAASVVLFIQTPDACDLKYTTVDTVGTSAETASIQTSTPQGLTALVPALAGFDVTYDDGDQHDVLTLECWVGAQPGAGNQATVIGSSRIADDSDHSGVGGVTVALVPVLEPTTCSASVPLVAALSGSPIPFNLNNDQPSAVQVSQLVAPAGPIIAVPTVVAALQGFVLSNVGQGGDSSVSSIAVSVSNPTFTRVENSNNWLATVTLDGVVQSDDGPFIVSSVQAIAVGLGTPG